MDRLKTFGKYIIWIVAFYIFSNLCIYIGFNATYKDIDTESNIPDQVNIDVAQATKVNGRIYGTVTSDYENNLRGKYIKIQIYTKYNNYCATKYLKIDDINRSETKKFAIHFEARNIKYYTIEIVDDNEEEEKKAIEFENQFKNVFKDKDAGIIVIILLLLTI